MDQHPIPRQITTFEFKLIGFMTLRQFLYLVIFIPLAFIIFKLFPIPLLNILLATAVGLLGVALAFVPINDRPLDVWIKNLIKRLWSPTQYFYHKENPPIYFLQDLFFTSDPHRVFAHIESQKKLAAYLSAQKKTPTKDTKKQVSQQLIGQSVVTSKAKQTESVSRPTPAQSAGVDVSAPANPPQTKHVFLSGVVKNNKKIALPGILIYIKDQNNNPVRLLKTNPHGIFASYNPLPKGEYSFEIKDPNNNYFFDTMKIIIEETDLKPLEFFSKELL